MIKFTLLGQLPSGKNAVKITRTGHRYPGKRFALWRENAQFMVPKQTLPYDEPLRITVEYYHGDLRRRDVPGMLDAILHLLEHGKFLTDDKHIVECMWTHRGLDRGLPRAEIKIETLAELSAAKPGSSTAKLPADKD